MEFPTRKYADNTLACCVPGCKSHSNGVVHVAFHRFPQASNEFVRNSWISAVKLKRFPASTTVVCSLHFAADNYNISGASSSGKRRRLLKDAIPTLNLPEFSDTDEATRRRIKRKKESNTDVKNDQSDYVVFVMDPSSPSFSPPASPHIKSEDDIAVDPATILHQSLEVEDDVKTLVYPPDVEIKCQEHREDGSVVVLMEQNNQQYKVEVVPPSKEESVEVKTEEIGDEFILGGVEEQNDLISRIKLKKVI